MNLSEFKEKRVLIMGLGLHGGGVGAAEFFASLGARVFVTDLKSASALQPSLAKLKRFKHITYRLGAHQADDFRKAEYIIKNPGVPDDSGFLKTARKAGVAILSDIEIFFRFCPALIIGVTGTKGKSTTTWLIGEFLNARNKKQETRNGRPRRQRVGAPTSAVASGASEVWVGGNIRRSMLEFLPRIKKNDSVVLELSSFQLDSLKHSRISPHIAVITNIFPDHLNRYSSMRSYTASKANIARFQKPQDFLFLNSRDGALAPIARRAKARVVRVRVDVWFRKFKNAFPVEPPEYHRSNIALAIAVAQHLGVGDSAIRKVLARFRGMPGRMEFVRNIGGVAFINDTTATNPQAGMEAIRATKTRIASCGLHVIAGGFDKKLPLGEYVNALSRNARSVVFLPGRASKDMAAGIERQKRAGPKIFHARTMAEAVKTAYRASEVGDVVLLSPGAASFGLFQHEFDRGEQFVKAVRALS